MQLEKGRMVGKKYEPVHMGFVNQTNGLPFTLSTMGRYWGVGSKKMTRSGLCLKKKTALQRIDNKGGQE